MALGVLDVRQAQKQAAAAAPLAPASKAGRGRAVAAMVVGLGVLTGAMATLPGAVAGTRTASPVAPAFSDVAVSDDSYVPGHSSGWHVHPGLHAVVVLSGTLTIYDEGCHGRDYGAGESYLGGRHPHLARNEGTEPVVLVITYVSPPAAVEHGSIVPPPSGCGVR